MTIFTFRVEEFEIENGCDDDISNILEEEILEAELGLVEANEGFLLSDEEVQKKAQSICME